MTLSTKPSEIAARASWLDRAFWQPAAGGDVSRFPISFRYDGQPSHALLPAWDARREEPRPAQDTDQDALADRELVLFRDGRTGLECRCEITSYAGYAAAEWVAWFKNTGETDTPILDDILPLDVFWEADAGEPCQVHHARGSLARPSDFEPLVTPLTLRQGGPRLDLAATTGKSSTLHLPFFNLEMGSQGVIAAIGWSGGWHASFQRGREGVRLAAGMERTHLVLHPGEEIRTPRILLLFWEGENGADAAASRVRSQNLWRRLVLAHFTPRPNGKLLAPPFCDGVWGAAPEASHLEKIRWLQENRIPTECYWIDAGWYGDRPIEEAADLMSNKWLVQAGTWSPNPEAYPHGFGAIGAAARAAGLGFLLWVEPERAFEGTQMVREHPEWVIGPTPSASGFGGNFMINLGIPEARRHVTDLVSRLIDEGGITCYRQDFNDLRVPEICAMADAPDRMGMTEIGHITGLYAFWDELLARHPGLVIDNCAGGGQRIDLETMARSVPLWRSDLQCSPFDPVTMQTQSQGLAPWVPLSAGVCDGPAPDACANADAGPSESAYAYAMRSALGPAVVTHWSSQALDGRAGLPVDRIRRVMDEALAVRKYFYGDFYPLLAWSQSADAWAVWQYDRPDLGEGLVVALRRARSPFGRCEARLQGLDADADYCLYARDDRTTRRLTGRQLMEDGFVVTIDGRPGSALFTYRRMS